MKALFVVALLAASVTYAQPSDPSIWNEQLRAELPKGLSAMKYKEWIRTIHAAGVNLINLNGYKYGMVEGQPIPTAVFQCVMFTLGHNYAVKMGWDGVARMAKTHMDEWCKDSGPGGPGAVAAALIADAEAAFINKHGAKARSEFQAPSSEQLKDISGRAATFTATVGTGAAILFIIGSLITG